MGVSSSRMHPNELVHFRKLTHEVPLESLDIPALPEHRRRTNVKWLIVLAVFLLVLMPFMIYTLKYSDIDRLVTGYDKCGNICGKKNYQWDGISCSGKNYTNYPYLKFENGYVGPRIDSSFDAMERTCVQSCSTGYNEHFGRCISSRKLNLEFTHITSSNDVAETSQSDLGMYFDSVKWHIVISCLLSIAVAVGMLFLFRYATHFIVWGILLGCFTALVIVTGFFWYGYLNRQSISSNRDDDQSLLIAAITFTVFSIIIGIVLACYRKKVHLVILLFKETTKAVFAMPRLMTVPVLCVLTVLLLTIIFLISTAFMLSAGYLKQNDYGSYSYQPTPVMVFTMVYNFIAFIWVSEFCVGIQYMIIAGAVSQWYFSRDKTFLGNPITTAASITFKFHLGTVAMGSLFITLVQLIKIAILSLIQNKRVRSVVNNHCLEPIERFFRFLSKNAYIVTALHGQAFLKSGRRAARLIFENIADIIAVNYIGDFVLGVAKILVVMVSLLLSFAIFNIAPSSFGTSDMPAYVVIGIVSALAAYVVFGVFETGIDTIFICYCEDSLLNDGMAKPYFMTRNLMEFVQKSKEIYRKN